MSYRKFLKNTESWGNGDTLSSHEDEYISTIHELQEHLMPMSMRSELVRYSKLFMKHLITIIHISLMMLVKTYDVS